jgi:hypothetical protein
MTQAAKINTHPVLTPLQSRAAEYIARHGMQAFMEEDYNLTGTRVRAVIRSENAPLALALDVPGVDGAELPVALDKKAIWAVIEGPRRDANRAELAQFFANPANVPELTPTQRMYMEWHYSAPNNYRLTLEKPLGDIANGTRLLGWNMETQVVGRGDFRIYTGLLGCTGLCAIAADGSAFMSHWDEECNPRQFDGYARFAADHPGGRIHVVGAVPRDLAAALKKRHPGVDVVYHLKRIYFETTYMVRFERIAGRVDVSFSETNVTDDYVHSCHNNEYGRWFPYGRFSQAFPTPEDAFTPCRFQPAP